MQDEQNIPLLKNVVDPDEIEYTDHINSIPSPEISDAQAIKAAIREEITAQLKQELQPLILSAINSAVEQATLSVRQIMLDELHGSLQNRVLALIAEALDKQLEKRHTD